MSNYIHLENASKNEKVLLEPFLYLTQHKGKEIRTKLLEAFDLWMRVPPAKLRIICDVVEMLHTASLLIDDVQDDSALRRGIPVAHKIYGVAMVINSANYVYFVALQRAMELDDPGIVQVFTEELLALHRGQGMEIYWRDSNICPSEEEYIDMVRNKTGGLLRLAVRLMQICSKSKVDFVPLVNKIGVHYQILDDYLNLTADQIADIIRQRTKDIDVKKYAIKLMQQTKTFEYTVTRLKELERESRTEIADLGGNPLLEKVIDFLGAYYLDK